MKFERIEVVSRDEYREAQRPQRFRLRERTFEVVRVLDQWYEGYMDAGRMPMRYFRVETSEGERFILRYHELFDAWAVLLPEEGVGGES